MLDLVLMRDLVAGVRDRVWDALCAGLLGLGQY